MERRKYLRMLLATGPILAIPALEMPKTTIAEENESPAEEATYTIFQQGSTIYAKNGATGAIDYSGADASTVIQKALDSLTAGRVWQEKVLLKGNFDLGYVSGNGCVNLPFYTILEIQGKLKLKNNVNKPLIALKPDLPEWGAAYISIIGDGAIIDGNRDNQTVDHYGVSLSANWNWWFLLKGLNIGNVRGYSLHAYQLGTLQMSDCSIGYEEAGGRQSKGGMLLQRVYDCQFTNVFACASEEYSVSLDSWSCVNIFTNCYFGGAGVKANVRLYGAYHNYFIGCQCSDSAQGGYIFEDEHEAPAMYNVISGGKCGDNSGARNGTYSNIVLKGHSHHNVIAGVTFVEWSKDRRAKYGVLEQDSANYNKINDCIFEGQVTLPVIKVGANTGVRGNIGCVTENSGTATIKRGTSSVKIPHGLLGTPTIVIPSGRELETDRVRCSARDKTYITLTVPTNVTADRIVDWYAEYKP